MNSDTLVIARHDTCGPWHLFLVRRSLEWCFIHLNVENGMVMIAGSFGAYDYMWRSIGDQHLFDFLAGIDFSYAAGKLEGPAGVFDADATFEGIRAHIIEGRRHGNYTKEYARRYWNQLHEWRHYGNSDPNDLYMNLDLDDCSEFFRYRHSGQFTGFWESIWRPFVAELYRFKETEAA